METAKETIEIIQDLIQINNDRIRGYERAIKELGSEDEDLKVLFATMIAQSHKAKMALAEEVQVMGKDVEKGATASGKIYRAWMDVKAMFTGHSRQAALENCDTGEDAAQKAYSTALKHEHLPSYLREMVELQMAALKKSHNEIKALTAQEADS